MVRICLDLFVEKGLYKTSTRDLSKAMNLQSGGLYYYFQSKDEAVVACVEAAIRKLEDYLITPVAEELTESAVVMKNLLVRAEEIAPVYRFVVTVCADRQYRDQTKPILDALGERYVSYAETFARLLQCTVQELAPFVYMSITAITNYMVFQEESFIAPQMKAAELKLQRILESRKRKENQ